MKRETSERLKVSKPRCKCLFGACVRACVPSPVQGGRRETVAELCQFVVWLLPVHTPGPLWLPRWLAGWPAASRSLRYIVAPFDLASSYSGGERSLWECREKGPLILFFCTRNRQVWYFGLFSQTKEREKSVTYTKFDWNFPHPQKLSFRNTHIHTMPKETNSKWNKQTRSTNKPTEEISGE